ncbi:hypothetical protein FHX08_000423 [Rhizobium sp. BK529]|uniref:hypothetical protein n=1 Tax=unclassified Rhizobium TaxID=2613769 RepID=UPI00104B61FC|nr:MULTISPECIES: hypothetical protein [unclassified Rhizobium]MBB3590079.1 hypothetical protein [Rhizobium sp. BK529]TCS04775.1 hypothetical protein EV281_103451 [Rhizobium sp. BK418]
MTRVATAPTLLICLALLSACNTTDALNLTPPMEIGDSSVAQRSSTPVTQSEAERMAGEPQQTFPASPRRNGYTPSYSQQTSPTRPNYSAQAYRPGTGAPPTTMQAQADALTRNGSSPAASGPIEGQSLPPPSSAAGQPTAPQQQPTQTAALDPSISSSTSIRGNTVRFLPIIGAPVQAVTPLSRQLGAEARAHGLAIKSSNDTSSDYILKGYLSAFSDEGKVTVVYVWDVLDNAGARLHRIQGQESVPTAAADPWAGVPASVMQQIASKTISEFTSWRQSQGG